MLDIAAILENRGTRLEWVENVSSVKKIPLTVGGGISTLEDIDLTLKAGADKVSMNSAAVNNPALVKEAAEKFGSERMAVAIDARRNPEMPSGFEVVVAGGTKPVGRDAVEWARECEKLGADVTSLLVWTMTEPRMATIWNSRELSPMPLTFQSSPLAERENYHISTMQLKTVVPPYCWLLQFFTSARLVSEKSRNIYSRGVSMCPFKIYHRYAFRNAPFAF